MEIPQVPVSCGQTLQQAAAHLREEGANDHIELSERGLAFPGPQQAINTDGDDGHLQEEEGHIPQQETPHLIVQLVAGEDGPAQGEEHSRQAHKGGRKQDFRTVFHGTPNETARRERGGLMELGCRQSAVRHIHR